MKTIKLSTIKARELYRTANKELKVILEENFTKKELQESIMDRVKTIYDVEELSPINFLCHNPTSKKEVSQNAFAKLQAIAEVLNEGWSPDFDNENEKKWYPYFRKLSSGWVFYRSGYFSYSGVGFGLYFKSQELADYAGQQFLDIYRDFLP